MVENKGVIPILITTTLAANYPILQDLVSIKVETMPFDQNDKIYKLSNFNIAEY